MTTTGSVEFGRLAGRLISPEEAALVEGELTVAGVPEISQWPLAVGRDYEDTVLMCSAYVQVSIVTGTMVTQQCRAWIDCHTPQAMAASLLGHVISARHSPGPFAR